MRSLPLLALLAALQPAPAVAVTLQEVPALAQAAAAGNVPGVEERLPRTPLVVPMEEAGRTAGRHGGTLQIIMGAQKDIRMMVVYGYARLVGFDENFELRPDILADVDNQGNRSFTLHLRPGHRWSDGHPFTAEDFRYYWEDVAGNEELSPFGVPRELTVDGDLPHFEVIDEHTARYTWSRPNPYFLPALAGASPLYIYRPAHYLKQFHADYADPGELEQLVEQEKTRNWAGLHHRKDHQYKNDNPDLPSLQPWTVTTRPPAERFVLVRNPYFHRVDPAGRPLPYIDLVSVLVTDDKLVPAKTGAGDADLQARYLRFDNYTFLREAEERSGYSVHLWQTVKGSQVALYPNFNVTDPVWRELVRDVRFRRALSLAVNRHEINQVVYYGLALEGNNSILPASPLYRPEYRSAWAGFDLEHANSLLDQIGLTERNGSGIRLLPDGRALEIIVETSGESTEESDVLELIHDSWLEAGVKLYTRPSQREVFRNRIFSGETVMSVWSGLVNGVPTAVMSPDELAPTTQQQLQWPQWGQHYETMGQAGEAPDMAVAQRLMELNRQWRNASDHAGQERAWREMLEIHAEQVFSIGTVAGVPQPVVVSDRLRNVPVDGVYNWDPGAYFGVYHPDAFWFDDSD